MLPGVYTATKKDGTLYYRSSITFRNKHISLGSFSSEMDASQAYSNANTLLHSNLDIENAFYFTRYFSFQKLVSLINFRDNNMYFATPIYLHKNYFSYYLTLSKELKFDIDDLFYYSSHKIMQRQGHLFVNDYGMQVTILSRYGVKPYAVCGRDYLFVNGDSNDYRYSNIEVINPYYGVTLLDNNRYQVKIHINGDYIVGIYKSIEKAAIAYNKAVDLVRSAGIKKKYSENYIETISPKEYAEIYTNLKISEKLIAYVKGLPN